MSKVEVVGYVNVPTERKPKSGYKRTTETLWCHNGNHNFRRANNIRGVKPRNCKNHK